MSSSVRPVLRARPTNVKPETNVYNKKPKKGNIGVATDWVKGFRKVVFVVFVFANYDPNPNPKQNKQFWYSKRLHKWVSNDHLTWKRGFSNSRVIFVIFAFVVAVVFI